MFTGIIEETGKIKKIIKNTSFYTLTIIAKKILDKTNIGDSISVNGVCLTVKEISQENFTADISFKTWQDTNFCKIKKSSLLNLERALELSDRLGGHIVQGHVEATMKIRKIIKKKEIWQIEIESPLANSLKIIKKGSLAVNGVSLTVQDLKPSTFLIVIIPHTLKNTNIINWQAGDFVNLETDYLLKR